MLEAVSCHGVKNCQEDYKHGRFTSLPFGFTKQIAQKDKNLKEIIIFGQNN